VRVRYDPVRSVEVTMLRDTIRIASLLALGVLPAASAGAQQPPPPSAIPPPPSAAATPPAAPPLEPKAIAVLKASSARLAAARTMAFTAIASYESPSLPGPALVYTTKSDVTVQRPDKLRV